MNAIFLVFLVYSNGQTREKWCQSIFRDELSQGQGRFQKICHLMCIGDAKVDSYLLWGTSGTAISRHMIENPFIKFKTDSRLHSI